MKLAEVFNFFSKTEINNENKITIHTVTISDNENVYKDSFLNKIIEIIDMYFDQNNIDDLKPVLLTIRNESKDNITMKFNIDEIVTFSSEKISETNIINLIFGYERKKHVFIITAPEKYIKRFLRSLDQSFFRFNDEEPTSAQPEYDSDEIEEFERLLSPQNQEKEKEEEIIEIPEEEEEEVEEEEVEEEEVEEEEVEEVNPYEKETQPLSAFTDSDYKTFY